MSNAVTAIPCCGEESYSDENWVRICFVFILISSINCLIVTIIFNSTDKQ